MLKKQHTLTARLIENKDVDGERLDTEEGDATVAKFTTPGNYLGEIASKVDLTELFKIVGFKQQNVLNSYKYPYFLIREVSEPKLIEQFYERSHVVEIWLKSEQTQSGYADRVGFKKVFDAPPKAMAIMKSRAAFSIEEEGSLKIYIIRLIDNQQPEVEVIQDPFGEEGGCTHLFVDDETLVVANHKKLIAYDSNGFFNQRKVKDPYLEAALPGDALLDLNLFSLTKSNILAAVTKNNGRDLLYVKLFGDKRQQFEFSTMAEFQVTESGDQYTVANVQAYESFVQITKNGHLEVAKLAGDGKIIPVLNTFLKMKAAPIFERGFTNAKINYMTLFLEKNGKTMLVPINRVDKLDTEKTESSFPFMRSQIENANFNPLIFKKYHLQGDYVFTLHQNILCVKNTFTKGWNFFDVGDRDLEKIKFRKYKENKVAIFFKDSNPLMFELTKRGVREVSAPSDFQVTDKVKYSFVPAKDASAFFVMKEEDKSSVYIVQDFKETIFLQNLPEHTNFIPFDVSPTEVAFSIYHTVHYKAEFHMKDIAVAYDYKNIGVPAFNLTEVKTKKGPQAKRLTSSILVYSGQAYYEYDFAKRKVVQLTEKAETSGGVRFVDVIGERYLYFYGHCYLNMLDLHQIKHIYNSENSKADVTKVSIIEPFIKSASFDYQEEKFAVLSQRLVIDIFPFLHQPKINFAKMLKNSQDFALVRVVEDDIFALSNEFVLFKYCAVTGKLQQTKDESELFHGYQPFLQTQCHKLICIKKQENTSINNYLATDSQQYKVFDMNVQNGLVLITEEASYTYKHKKHTIAKFNKNCTLMLEGFNKDMKLFELRDGTWVEKAALPKIASYDHVSPHLGFYYSKEGEKHTIFSMETQEPSIEIPEYIASCIKDLVMSKEGSLTVTTKDFLVRELSYDNCVLQEINRYRHGFKSYDQISQYLRSNITLASSVPDNLQSLARLNDYYQYNVRFAHNSNFQAVFSIMDYFKQGRSYVTFPFTYYHWKLMESLQDKSLNIETIPDHVIYELLFVILPNGDSLLHLCAENVPALSYLNEFIKKHNISETSLGDLVQQIPYVKNLVKSQEHPNGQTPLDRAIAINNVRSSDILVQILKILQLDSHFEETKEALPQLFQLGLKSFTDYFDARLFDIETIGIDYQRCQLLCKEDCDFALTTTYQGEKNIAKMNNEISDEYENEVPVKVQVLDLPNAHKFGGIGTVIMEQLAETDNLEMFQSLAVRAIIEFKWPLIKKQIVKFLFLPYLSFLVTFCIYSLWIFESQANAKTDEDKAFYGALAYVFIVLNLLQSAYLFLHECKQIIDKQASYFSSPWNYIDLAPILLIWCAVLVTVLYGEPKTTRPIYAIAAFFMWIKFLYFLRIFRGTGYLISMIIEVVADMRVFLYIFFITLAAFGHCFFILALNNDNPDSVFIKGTSEALTYTYRMALGDFATDNFGEEDLWLVWIMFLLATVFLLIVMFNLLIAIISDTFERVQEQANNTMYRSMAELIFENEYLVTKSSIQEFNDESAPYLVIASAERDDGDGGNAWEGKLQALKSSVAGKHAQMQTTLDKLKRDTQLQAEKVDEILGKMEGQINGISQNMNVVLNKLDTYFAFGNVKAKLLGK